MIGRSPKKPNSAATDDEDAQQSRFNDRKAYPFEELVAEISNCMLCSQIGVESEFDQSDAYVEGCLKVMKEDSRAIFRAASEAQKALDYIMERTVQAERMDAEKQPEPLK